MPAKKKIKTFKQKNSEKTDEKNIIEPDTRAKEDMLVEELKKATEGLYYISETDAEIYPFTGEKAEAVAKEEILKQVAAAAGTSVEERSVSEFFARLTEIQDWFGDEEKQTAQRFTRLQEFLEKNLRDIKVFKLGKVQLDVYVVGLDSESRLAGIKTKAVET